MIRIPITDALPTGETGSLLDEGHENDDRGQKAA